jgi:hypothetical protein
MTIPWLAIFSEKTVDKMKFFLKAVGLTAVCAGTTDMLAAVINSWIRSGNFPTKVFHFIAGGVLGLEAAMKGGIAIGILGFVIHYLIAFSWTLLFFLIFFRTKSGSLNRYYAGILYGLFVGVCMTFLVLPLTALPESPFSWSGALMSWAILAFFLGIPISLGAHFWRSKSSGLVLL